MERYCEHAPGSPCFGGRQGIHAGDFEVELFYLLPGKVSSGRYWLSRFFATIDEARRYSVAYNAEPGRGFNAVVKNDVPIAAHEEIQPMSLNINGCPWCPDKCGI